MRTTVITVLILLFSQNYVFAQNEKESNSNFTTLEDKYFDKKALKEIDSLLNFQYKSNEPGVAILVTQGDEIVLNKSYGMANLEMNIKMLPTHVFKIASITKPFTAFVIFDLIANGNLELTDPVTKYIPQLNRKYESVQIRHLLSHTSGIINYGETDEFETLYSKYYFDFVNEEISGDSVISILNKYDLKNSAGDNFSYCNSGYFLLERIVENITGEKFTDFTQRLLFEPIKMDNTGFYSVTDIVKNRISGYTFSENRIINNPHVFLDGILTKGDGGMVSCTYDLFLWYQAIFKDEYFRNISYRYYTHPFILNDSTESYYSMGFFTRKLKGRKMLNHNGDASGFASSMIILPDDDIFIIILGNNDLYSFGSSRYHENVAKRIAAILLDDPFPNYKDIILDDEELSKFQGAYKSDDNVIRKILLKDGKLYTQRNNGRKIRIHPYAANKFYYNGYLINLTFFENELGEIASFSINYDDGRKIIANKISND
jgi:CubicO group peptidase (beta-lactamase class C family)